LKASQRLSRLRQSVGQLRLLRVPRAEAVPFEHDQENAHERRQPRCLRSRQAQGFVEQETQARWDPSFRQGHSGDDGGKPGRRSLHRVGREDRGEDGCGHLDATLREDYAELLQGAADPLLRSVFAQAQGLAHFAEALLLEEA